MRNRSICPPYFSDAVASLDDKITVPWATMSKWIFSVATWTLDISISDAGGDVHVGSYGVSWNQQNNRTNGNPAGGPGHEAHLATGWQIEQDLFPTSGVANGLLYFFNGLLAGGGSFGTGCRFIDPTKDVDVFFSVIVGAGKTTESGGSGVTVDIDGFPSAFDDFGFGYSGFISMQPSSFWEYRKSDGTNPMYNASTGAALISRQTDELP